MSDERRVATWLYPAQGVADTRATLSGTVFGTDGSPLSGVNVVAVDTAAQRVYSTVTDYYSGGSDQHVGTVDKTGSYTFHALPPGSYFIAIEPLANGNASYNSNANSSVKREWYSGTNESSDWRIDDVDNRRAVNVEPGDSIEGIDLVENDYSDTRIVFDHESRVQPSPFRVPATFDGIHISGIAQQLRAPTEGVPAMVRIPTPARMNVQAGSRLIIGIHRKQYVPSAEAWIPGKLIGSVTVPMEFISPYQDMLYALESIKPGVRIDSNDLFQVSVRLAGPGNYAFYRDVKYNNETIYGVSYDIQGRGWVPHPAGSYTLEAAGTHPFIDVFFVRQEPLFSGAALKAYPDTLAFDNTYVGFASSATVDIVNPGAKEAVIDQMSIEGPDAQSFSICSSDVQQGSLLRGGHGGSLCVTFEPTRVGVHQADLLINDTLAIPLVGTCVPAIIAPIVQSIDFGQQEIDWTTSLDTVILYNPSEERQGVNVSMPASNALTITRGGGNTTLEPGDSLTLAMEFTPLEKRMYGTGLQITFEQIDDTLSVAVVGEGVDNVRSPFDESAGLGEAELIVIPNPAPEDVRLEFRVDGENSGQVHIDVVNASGRTVLSAAGQLSNNVLTHAAAATLSTEEIPAGWYLVRVMLDERTYSAPMIVH
jgi:hypothetical protein